MLAKSLFIACALIVVAAFMISSEKPGQPAVSTAIPAGSKVFIDPMDDGFDTYLKAALAKKKVPLMVVPEKSGADFEITGHSETQKAGAAKKIIMLNWHSNEQASISITNLKTSEIVYSYSANKQSSAHGKQSTAEACAKHIKEKIESYK
jgi:hypothetical protein